MALPMTGAGAPAVDLGDLRLFVVVAEELHFGRAAIRLHLSQPGLSYRVKALVNALGYQVLARNRRGVRLTPAGEVLLAGARRLLGEAHRAVDDGAGSPGRAGHSAGRFRRFGVVQPAARGPA
ncbi:LysR family transcriptional regulator [Actinoplanes sp. NPDC049668]|uniref:LysR family transcriptional regulator n=1 Tax=unclassified Actinoplanes TaxID=2626549 RepID=UPI0033A2CA98